MASSLVSHNGYPIAPWTETAMEFQVLQKFPHLRRRLEDGLHCLSRTERVQLQLVRLQCSSTLTQTASIPTPACRPAGVRGGLKPHLLCLPAQLCVSAGGRESGSCDLRCSGQCLQPLAHLWKRYTCTHSTSGTSEVYVETVIQKCMQ
jgi:hypothetical protein